MSACDPSDDAYNPPLRRDLRGLASRLCRCLMITVLWVALPFVFSAGLLVIYENLGSRSRNGQRMGPQDTCSTLTARLPRSTHTTEKLNPAGTTPAELAPDNWHLDPRQPHTVVYTADGIRRFHRNGGLLWLAIVTTEVLQRNSHIERWRSHVRMPAHIAHPLLAASLVDVQDHRARISRSLDVLSGDLVTRVCQSLTVRQLVKRHEPVPVPTEPTQRTKELQRARPGAHRGGPALV